VVVCLVSVFIPVVEASAAQAAAPVRGSFSIGDLASFDDLSKFIRGSNVSCVWQGDRVVVRLTLRNTSIESIKATVKPRYYIARGSEHGSGFTSGKEFRLRGGHSLRVSIDAGSPEGTPRGAKIGRCAPYLYLVDHG
jgi:hypothetical protein